MMRRRVRRNRRKKSRFLLPTAILCLLLAVYFTAFSDWLNYLRYPLREKARIVANAQEYHLEPWHVAAVILCESSFNEKACSSVGARGLMQLMPETGEWIALKRGDKDFSADDLYTAETNMRYGCWYLQYLMDRYGGDRTLTTAAYHAGPNRVDNWLADPAISPDGATLSRIPYSSTATYVKRVLSACEVYKELYDFET